MSATSAVTTRGARSSRSATFWESRSTRDNNAVGTMTPFVVVGRVVAGAKRALEVTLFGADRRDGALRSSTLQATTAPDAVASAGTTRPSAPGTIMSATSTTR